LGIQFLLKGKRKLCLRLFIQRIESEKYSRSSAQSLRIFYRDIGLADSAMEEGENLPHIAPHITDAEEIMRLLA
jgi:hypothetical protein